MPVPRSQGRYRAIRSGCMQLSTHFTRAEFIHSQWAVRNGVTNEPSEPQWLLIEGLCQSVLEPARERYGKAITISSGYRGPKVNRAVGGADRSDHQVLGTAAAADLVVADLGDLFRIVYWLQWSKLIWEFGNWIHVSWDQHGPPRGRVPWIKSWDEPLRDLTYEEMCVL